MSADVLHMLGGFIAYGAADDQLVRTSMLVAPGGGIVIFPGIQYGTDIVMSLQIPFGLFLEGKFFAIDNNHMVRAQRRKLGDLLRSPSGEFDFNDLDCFKRRHGGQSLDIVI